VGGQAAGQLQEQSRPFLRSSHGRGFWLFTDGEVIRGGLQRPDLFSSPSGTDLRAAFADGGTEQMQIFDNGQLVKTMPISLGSPGFPTHNGPHVISDRQPSIIMDSCTYGVCKGQRGYYRERVDLDERIVIDMVKGNSASDLHGWLDRQDPGWLAAITVVTTDLAESYRKGLSDHLEHAVRVADPFHVVRVANRCLDKVRRRVQNETLDHRGRKADPLHRLRKLLLARHERLDQRGLELGAGAALEFANRFGRAALHAVQAHCNAPLLGTQPADRFSCGRLHSQHFMP